MFSQMLESLQSYDYFRYFKTQSKTIYCYFHEICVSLYTKAFLIRFD